ncbi:hypothetical protein [Acetanaerobacterium elongatum]|uniref:Phage gp6-like head-tail connector protein n=1 Tax=Acetanaerobacterium elongatum TaxID=258515 RepID=A0A1G9Z137_9FIRM|nr:hypothetical protein [Acetanaerobacterium elongatum]SDN15089.1 hypothetical protein SAMN05192585_11256 [Acetanaerobacterium elongatum]
MPKTEQDVFAEISRRYGVEMMAQERYLSYICQVKEEILSYCNIPQGATMPDGLFYPWVELSYAAARQTQTVQGTGAVKSITEGDTTITYDVGTTVIKNSSGLLSYANILNRYRRMPR